MAMEKFHYETEHGEIVCSKFSQLPMGLSRRVRKLDPGDQIFEMIEATLDTKNIAIFDKLSQEQGTEFIQAWQEDSGITVGESSESSKK